MLPKPNRLKSKGEFKRTLAGRRLFGCPFFVLYGLERPSQGQTYNPPTRVGFIVSKKIHKRATQRNRIRRRLRELVRLHLQNTSATGFADYRALVFIARPDALNVSFGDLKFKMERCLQGLRPSAKLTLPNTSSHPLEGNA